MSDIIVAFVPIYQTPMRTGRPVKKETPYKIIVHTNGGRRYASTKVTIVGEDGRKQSRHKHWGTVDDNSRFHPNTTYFNASPRMRTDIHLQSKVKGSEARPSGQAQDRGSGDYVYFFKENSEIEVE